MRKLLPIILAFLGIGAGIGAGFYFKPAPMEPEDAPTLDACLPSEGESVDAVSSPVISAPVDPATREYVRLNNQFVVPVVMDNRVSALVVLSISVEVEKGQSQAVFDREPKLRDLFLQVLFNHANIGGFQGAFTDTRNMTVLRRHLRDAGKSVMGDFLSDVLITDIARQDT